MTFLWAFLLLLLDVWPGVVAPAHAQGSRKDDIVFNSRGIPLAGATVRVCAMPASGQPCSPLALIYSDAALTQALANPTTTDGLGNYFFYAAPGKYEIEISGPGITTKQLPNIILPNDPSSPTFSGISAFSLNLSGNLTVNGNTTVVGNLASGTLNVTNQGTSPGTPAAGTVNLYTKTADKRLYYKDDTGTEVGPVGAGAQTSITNTFTASQNFDADVHLKGPNPYADVTRYGVRAIAAGSTPAVPGITATINNGSTGATVSTASCPGQAGSVCFQTGDGVVIYGAGATQSMTTPGAPTVTPSVSGVMTGTGDVRNAPAGSTTYNYKIIACDKGQGCTAASAAGSTATGSATLGGQSVNITSMSRSGNVVTVTTSATHGLSVGAGVLINSGNSLSDASFSGWYQVATVPDPTHFTFTSGQTTANGATASATGGVVFWWNCNHVTYASVTGAYRYWLLSDRGSPGTFAVVAVSKPVNGSFVSGTLAIDDFGSPMMDGITTPAYLPASPFSSATSDSLVTTIVSGAGSTSLTLTNAAGTTVTNATILFDNEPNLKAAATAAPSYPVYVPFSTVSGGSYVVNSFLDLAPINPTLLVPGGLYLNDTMTLGSTGKLLGDVFPQTGSAGGQFSFEGQAGIICKAIPCLHLTNGNGPQIRGVTFFGGTNQVIDVVQDGGGGATGPSYERVNFSGANNSGDYMSIPLYMRGISGNVSANGHFRKVAFNVGPNQVDGLTATPAWYCDDCGTMNIDSAFFNRRSMVFKGDPAGNPINLQWGYIQGGIMPFVTLWGGTGTLDIAHVTLDTMGHPLVANLPGALGSASVMRTFNAGTPALGMPLVTGSQLGAVTGTTSGQNTAAISGSNFTDNPISINGAGNYSYALPVPGAPGTAVSAGGGVPVGAHNYRITWVDALGYESAPSVITSATTTSGNQTVTITPPAAPANSGITGFFVYRDQLRIAQNVPACPNQSPLNGTYVDTGSQLCTTSGGPPQFPGGGVVDIGSNGISSPFFKLPGTAGSAAGASATLAPSVYTVNRTQTFPDVTGIVPVSSYLNSAYDNATRANGAIGSNWTIQQNGLSIASNQIQGTTAAASNTAFWNANLFAPAQFAQATITALNGASDFPGVTVLAGGTGSSSTYYDCVENSTTIFIQRVVNAGTTNLTSTGSAGAVGDILRLEVAPGGALTCYKNGAVALTSTDTQITAGSPGLLISGNVATEKNWSGGNLHPLAHLDAEQDWTRPQHFVQGIALGGSSSESFNSSPRAGQNVFLPGALTSTWTGATWTTDKAVTVTRVQVQAKTAPAGCTTNAVVRLTDGTTPVNVTISAAANDSGAISQNYAAGASLQILVQTAAAGCTTSPADVNVVVQYRMQ